MTERPAILYALSTCSHCRNTKRLLGELGIDCEIIDVDLLDDDERKTVLAEVRKLNPSVSFPTLVVGERVIVGYREREIKEAFGIS